jgi:hypothetical protein
MDQNIITNMNVGFGGHVIPSWFITRKQLGRMAISHVPYVANRRLLCIAGNAEKKTEIVQHFVGTVEVHRPPVIVVRASSLQRKMTLKIRIMQKNKFKIPTLCLLIM